MYLGSGLLILCCFFYVLVGGGEVGGSGSYIDVLGKNSKDFWELFQSMN